MLCQIYGVHAGRSETRARFYTANARQLRHHVGALRQHLIHLTQLSAQIPPRTRCDMGSALCPAHHPPPSPPTSVTSLQAHGGTATKLHRTHRGAITSTLFWTISRAFFSPMPPPPCDTLYFVPMPLPTQCNPLPPPPTPTSPQRACLSCVCLHHAARC